MVLTVRLPPSVVFAGDHGGGRSGHGGDPGQRRHQPTDRRPCVDRGSREKYPDLDALLWHVQLLGAVRVQG